MNTTMAVRKIPIAMALLLTAGWAAGACTTTEVTSPPDSGGASSSGSGSGGSSGSSGSSSGTNPGDDGSASMPDVIVPPTVCGVPPSPDGGFAPLIDFSMLCGGDAGASLACFGAYPTLYGGTYSYASTTDSLPNDAGVGCAVYGSQSTFATTIDTVGKSWNWSGTVAGFSGGGLYIVPCANAAAYTGIQFTMSGTLGITAGDAGASTQMQFQVSQLQNWPTASGGGLCLSADGGPGTDCNPSVFNFDVPATSTVIQVPWTALTGGTPDMIFDPAHIIQIQWQLPWPCTGGTPYAANVSIQNVQFYK
jgi:hypothetical protein